MFELLYKLLIGHIHKYEVVEQNRYDKFETPESTLPHKKVLHIIQKCSVCGNIKHTKINED